MGLSQSEAKKSEEYAAAEEESKCLAEEAAGGGEKSAAEVTEDGSFLLGLVFWGGSLHRRFWMDCIDWVVSAGTFE